MGKHFNFNDAMALMKPPGWLEIERRHEMAEIAAEKRRQLIHDCSTGYLQDVGTFFEFIQSIEISVNDEGIFFAMHQDVLAEDECNVGKDVCKLFKAYCDRLATKDVDKGIYQ